MKNLLLTIMGILSLGAMVACGDADRIQGGANPEETALPPDPNFNVSAGGEACITQVNSVLGAPKCWKRGVSGEENYSELWFVSDSDDSTTGLMGYEIPSDTTDFDYSITSCDGNQVKMSQAGGISITLTTQAMDFKFDEWAQAYRYTSSNDCTLSPK